MSHFQDLVQDFEFDKRVTYCAGFCTLNITTFTFVFRNFVWEINLERSLDGRKQSELCSKSDLLNLKGLISNDLNRLANFLPAPRTLTI